MESTGLFTNVLGGEGVTFNEPYTLEVVTIAPLPLFKNAGQYAKSHLINVTDAGRNLPRF